MELAASTLYLTGEASSMGGGADRLTAGLALAAQHVSRDPAQRQAALRGVHPDVLLLQPETSRGKIGIDQVREVLRAAQFVPEQGERRVCLIPSAEKLTPQAANGLLKVLEEPPRGMVFVLVAAHAQDVLPTVLSRLRVVRSAAAFAAGGNGTGSNEGADVGFADGIDSRSAASLDQAMADPRSEVRERGAVGAIAAIERRDRRTIVALAKLLAKRDDAEIGLALDALMRSSAAALRREVRATEASRQKSGWNRQRKLAALCRAVDEAQRGLWVYTPKEAVLVRLFLCATEGETNA